MVKKLLGLLVPVALFLLVLFAAASCSNEYTYFNYNYEDKTIELFVDEGLDISGYELKYDKDILTDKQARDALVFEVTGFGTEYVTVSFTDKEGLPGYYVFEVVSNPDQSITISLFNSAGIQIQSDSYI